MTDITDWLKAKQQLDGWGQTSVRKARETLQKSEEEADNQEWDGETAQYIEIGDEQEHLFKEEIGQKEEEGKE